MTSIGASATPGTLAAGTGYYKVSAILDAANPDNPGGETLPSEEQILTIGGAGGAIALAWDPFIVNGLPAVAYRTYRNDAVNGVSQTEHLVATVGGTSTPHTGDAAGVESPLPPGATGVWTVDIGTLTAARWGEQATDTTFCNIRTGMRDVGFLGDGSLDTPIQSAADTRLRPARSASASSARGSSTSRAARRPATTRSPRR